MKVQGKRISRSVAMTIKHLQQLSHSGPIGITSKPVFMDVRCSLRCRTAQSAKVCFICKKQNIIFIFYRQMLILHDSTNPSVSLL